MFYITKTLLKGDKVYSVINFLFMIFVLHSNASITNAKYNSSRTAVMELTEDTKRRKKINKG